MIWHTAAACVVAAAIGATGGFQLRSLIADREDRDRIAAALEAERLAVKARDRQQGITDAIARDYHARTVALARAAAADRAVADGLRDSLAAVTNDGEDSPAACADVRRQRNVLAELVGEAGELVAECKAAGDRLAEQAGQLRRHASEISTLPVKD